MKAPKRILLKVTYLASLFLAGEISPKKNTHTHTHTLSLSLSLSLSLKSRGFFGDSIARNK
jgi:hypothetical protein